MKPAVLEVCARTLLGEKLQIAMDLARAAFAPVRDLRVEVDTDPETGDQHLVIDVWTELDGDALLRRYADYTRQWVETAPPAARYAIRLSYHLTPAA